jgi:hypothetical protein
MAFWRSLATMTMSIIGLEASPGTDVDPTWRKSIAFEEKLNCGLHLSVVQFELDTSER